jgi:hypothetical protein
MFSGTSHDADPFTYNPNYNAKFTNIAYSMRQRTHELDNNKNPGPGAYERVIKSSSSPFYS